MIDRPEGDSSAFRREVDAIGSLADAIRWASSRTPRAEFVAAIAQDEFTHDIILRAGPDVFLVLDAT